MLNIYSDTKIYVHCPAGVVTGGAELLHQLVSFLRDNNRNAYIVYFGNQPHNLPDDYRKYNIVTTEMIEDNNHNIEVFFEGIFNVVTRYSNTQKFLWWISVENFYIFAYDYLSLSDLFHWNIRMGLKRSIERLFMLLHGHHPCQGILKVKDLIKKEIPCGYQAEFIQDYLHKLGFSEIVPLKDYINIEHCIDFTPEGREDIVVYNPKKGFEFTQKLINSTPEIQWVPLQNMSRKELIATIRRAKLYVDFGFHPGKDRLPRECAMNGCCIITGKRGTASYFEDVPIPGKYKFNENQAKIEDIVSTIKWALHNYDNAINDFAYYRNIIRQEKAEFEQQIRNIFNLYNVLN